MLGLTSGWCAQYAPPTPPALPAPAAPQTYTQMTVPGAYTPEQSEIDTQTAAAAGASNFLQTVNLAPVSGPCDWTQATWSDPSTYCVGNWAIVGLAVAGVVAVIAMKGKR